MRKIIATCIVAAMFLCSFSVIFADEPFQPTDIKIPVKYDAGSNKKTAVFVLTAKDENAPMPEGAVDGKVIVKKKGSGNVDFGSIHFDKPDYFEYSVDRMDRGKRVDRTHYDVKIAALYDGNRVIIMRKDGNDKKSEAVLYQDEKDKLFPSPETGDMQQFVAYTLCVIMLIIAVILFASSENQWNREFKRLIAIAKSKSKQ